MESHNRHPVHYELYIRRAPHAAWTLEQASEGREQVIATAQEIFSARKGVAVKVSKEILDPETGEYSSATILSLDEASSAARPRPVETQTVCTSPADLYSPTAREKITRLLRDWLAREKVTAFELLHRPDLAQKLEGTDHALQHVVQKLAVPESQETGQDLHELMRNWQALIDRAIARLVADGKAGRFVTVGDGSDVVELVGRLHDEPERTYLLGGSLAKSVIAAPSPEQRLERLLPLAQSLGGAPPSHHWALAVVEELVTELLAMRTVVNAIVKSVLGHEPDAGEALMALTRMASALTDGSDMPEVMVGYGELIQRGLFVSLRHTLFRHLIAELKGPRRLRPGDAEGEIETLRALALSLSVAGRDEALRDDIHDAFVERSRLLVSSEFVEALLRDAADAVEEIERLIWLSENVVGTANKHQAGQWLLSQLTAVKFERQLSDAVMPITARLSLLARLQARIREASLSERDTTELNARLGMLGGQMATEARLWAQLSKAKLPPMQKLQVLLELAAAQTGPSGPVADAAKTEVMKLLRKPDVRQALSAEQAIARLKPLIIAAGIAA